MSKNNEDIKNKIKIRNYRKSDYKDTLELMKEMSEIFSFYFDVHKWDESAGLRLFQPGYSRTTLVAELEGVGIVAMGFIEMHKSPDGLNIGYLSNWGVRKKFRGHGIGRLLEEKAINILEKMGADLIRIKIALKPDPTKILKLVEKVGFEPKYITVEKKINKKK
ncbi:MAG: GNAT family N-acetyltransferase [Promethearchaeota archaeon]